MSLMANLFHLMIAHLTTSGFHVLTSRHVSKKIMKEKKMDHTEIPFPLQEVKGVKNVDSP